MTNKLQKNKIKNKKNKKLTHGTPLMTLVIFV